MPHPGGGPSRRCGVAGQARAPGLGRRSRAVGHQPPPGCFQLPLACLSRWPAVSLLIVVVLVAVGGAAADPSHDLARQRALASYAAMQKYFYSPATRSYTGTYPAGKRAQAWPYSQALWATVDLARLPGVGGEFRGDLLQRIRSLSAYNRPQPRRPDEYAPVYGGQGNVYYDDNLWIALALVRATGVLHDTATLAAARQIFTLVGDGWDTNASHPCPGGVFWTRSGNNHDRNTVTTANAALLAMLLYERSPSPLYLTWAERAYAWVQGCLGTPSGLVADHLDLKGRADPHTWSYNQGAMIAAGVRLFKATGKRRYLADAERTASASLAAIGDPLASGEPAVFLAIFYRDLLDLAQVDGRPDRRAALERFADEAWARARDPKTGLFHFGHGPTLLDQAAMVQVYAELATTS